MHDRDQRTAKSAIRRPLSTLAYALAGGLVAGHLIGCSGDAAPPTSAASPASEAVSATAAPGAGGGATTSTSGSTSSGTATTKTPAASADSGSIVTSSVRIDPVELAETAESLARRATFLEELGSLESASDIRAEIVRISRLLYGEGWQTQVARLRQAALEEIMQKDLEAQRQFRQLHQLAQDFEQALASKEEADARKEALAGVAAAKTLFGEQHLIYSEWLVRLGRCPAGEGEGLAPEAAIQQAMKIQAGLVGEESEPYVESLMALSEHYRATGKTTAADETSTRLGQLQAKLRR